MAGEPWFRTEETGWAAQPANWKGWAALGLWLAAIALWAVVMFSFMPSGGMALVFFVIGVLVFTGILVAVAVNKTEGRWAWQNDNSDRPGH